MVHKLITVEKLLVSQVSRESMVVKLFNGYQLLTVYFKMGDYSRVVKLYDAELVELCQKFKALKDIGESVNHILHIESILADSLMM